MKVVIVDFDDSFTYNLLAELKRFKLSAQVICWTEFDEKVEFDLLVLGPGPGHPHDYAALFPLLQSILKSPKKVLGVCLGHQIIWNLQEALVTRSKHPMHGEKMTLKLNEFWSKFFGLGELVVQRYNSLAVLEHSVISDAQLLSYDNEVMISLQPHIVGVQFHPESLGTSNRSKILHALLKHLLAS